MTNDIAMAIAAMVFFGLGWTTIAYVAVGFVVMLVIAELVR